MPISLRWTFAVALIGLALPAGAQDKVPVTTPVRAAVPADAAVITGPEAAWVSPSGIVAQWSYGVMMVAPNQHLGSALLLHAGYDRVGKLQGGSAGLDYQLLAAPWKFHAPFDGGSDRKLSLFVIPYADVGGALRAGAPYHAFARVSTGLHFLIKRRIMPFVGIEYRQPLDQWRSHAAGLVFGLHFSGVE